MMTQDRDPPGRAVRRFGVLPPTGLPPAGGLQVTALAWFNDRLYLAGAMPEPGGRGRIFALDPLAGLWETIWESPDITHATGARLPRDFGIHSLAVLQDATDTAPCLYGATMSDRGTLILRSEDGLQFAPVSEPGLGMRPGDPLRISAMALAGLEGRLFALPLSVMPQPTSAEADRSRRRAPALLHVRVAGQTWEPASAPGLGSRDNVAISAIAAAHGHVYAATRNPLHGFQLWRSRAGGAPPFAWEKVLSDGAMRHTLNPGVTRMLAFGGDLYLGTGITGTGPEEAPDAASGAAELIRVRPDGSWDLLVGAPRFTPDGLKVPLSALGPGFDNAYNTGIAALAEHDGVLYAATRNWEARHRIELGQNQGRDAPLEGGFELWASADGAAWSRVIAGGNGTVSATTVSALCATPQGLCLASLQEAQIIAHELGGWSGMELPGQAAPADTFQILRSR